MARAWNLHISSFGECVGHGHVYGTLGKMMDHHYVDVEDVLTEKWAGALNSLEDDFEYHPGMECSRFLDVGSCLRRGIEMFLELAEDGDILYGKDYDPIAKK